MNVSVLAQKHARILILAGFTTLTRLSLCLCVSQVKSAASYALGSIAVGNLPEYLPFVLQEISSSKRQYLLLHSLKEIISKSSPHVW